MAAEPPTPADRIRAAMEERGWTEADLAWTLGYSLHALGRVLDGEIPITPQLALRLEAALEEKAEVWLDVARDHDLWQLRERMGGETARIIRRRAGGPVPDLP